MNRQEYVNQAAKFLQEYLKEHGLLATVGCSGHELFIYNPEQVFFYFPNTWEGLNVILKYIGPIETIGMGTKLPQPLPDRFKKGGKVIRPDPPPPPSPVKK